MKVKLLCTFILLIASISARAEGLYLGIDRGALVFEQVEFNNVANTGFLVGYQFDNWAVEGIYNTSSRYNDAFRGEQNVDMYHLYSVYRSSGNIYYKLKFGLTNERYQFHDDADNLRFDDVHTGIARGLGIGYRANSHQFELEYSLLGGSLELLSLGVRFNF